MPSPATTNVTPISRAQEFPSDFYSEKRHLRCKFCSSQRISLKLSTIKNHINSAQHTRRKRELEHQKPILRQVSLETSIKGNEERSIYIKNFVAMCLATNTPLERAPKMQHFLTKYCRIGGIIPSPNRLREHYLPLVSKELKMKIMKLIEHCISDSWLFTINVDETCDDREQYIVHVILKFREHCVLLESVFLDNAANFHSLSKIVNETLVSYNLSQNSVVYLTDNTAYCVKSFTDVLSRMYPQLVWVGCWAHIVDLCGDCWQSHFKLSNKFCSLMKQFFKKKSSAGRKKRWISHLKNNGVVRPCLPPTANFTRWTSWLKITQYHAKYIEFYPAFIAAELDIADAAYLSELQEKLSSSFEILRLHLTFLSEHGEKLISMIEFFEIQYKPVGHCVYNAIIDFNAILEGGTASVHFMPKTDALLNSVDTAVVASSIELFMEAFRLARDKLRKHIDSQTSSLEMFKSIRVFDPRQLSTLSRDITSFSNLHGFSLSKNGILGEWAIYRNAVYVFDESFDIAGFWKKKTKLPTNFIDLGFELFMGSARRCWCGTFLQPPQTAGVCSKTDDVQ